ncbi:MAG: response regulator [Anaerolineales bacterium]|jgi:DNA-binding response OmpR family regulator
MIQHILTVDDDELMRRSLGFNLEQAGYRVSSASSAEDALALARRDPPDLVIMDIGLPGMDGLEALKHLRSQVNVPVIFLTARRREFDEVLGLELGADDYVTKPFDFDVLNAHIKALFRRIKTPQTAHVQVNSLTVGDLYIDPAAHLVTRAGKSLELTPLEFDLLHALALQPNRVLSVDDLLAQVWGAEYRGESQVVYVHMRWLRQKLEENPDQPRRIVTVRGVGYKLVPQDP